MKWSIFGADYQKLCSPELKLSMKRSANVFDKNFFSTLSLIISFPRILSSISQVVKLSGALNAASKSRLVFCRDRIKIKLLLL